MISDRTNAWPRLSMVVGIALVAFALMLAGGALVFSENEESVNISPRAVAQRKQALHELALQYVSRGQLARADGYVKTIDAAQLLWYFALAGDRASYEPLRDRVVSKTVVESPDRPISRYFVAWRYWPGDQDKPLDASGTTEALRLAKALWLGARQFDRNKDRTLAMRILRGYTRHQATFDGVWLIQNYYHLKLHHFATNSYTIDYDPDLLAAAADHTGDETLKGVADKSTQLVKRALSPAGLVRQIIQPELRTLMPDEDAIFSPNDLEQLSNSAEVATGTLHTAPEVARRVLDFAMQRVSDLRLLYNASTGNSATKTGVGVETYGPLLRLAVRRDRPGDVETLLRHVMQTSEPAAIKQLAPKSRAYNLGQALLALQRVQRYRDESASIVTLP
jgi:hypothetical protein